MKLKDGYTQDDLLRLIREGVSAGLDAISKPADEEVKPEPVNETTGSDDEFYFEDLDGDSEDDIITFEETPENQGDIKLKPLDGVDDWAFKGVDSSEKKEEPYIPEEILMPEPEPVEESVVTPNSEPVSTQVGDTDTLTDEETEDLFGGIERHTRETLRQVEEEANAVSKTPVATPSPKKPAKKLAKIIDFKRREEIPESGEFFDLSEEEKFNTVEQAVQANMQAFQRQMELEELAKDVSSALSEKLSMYSNKGVQEGKRKAYNSPKSDRHTKDRALFTNDTLDMGGKVVKYTRHTEVPAWNMDLLECITTDDKAMNFEQIRRKITEEFINYFGGLNRIQTIYVQSYQLIINGVCYVPKLSKQVLLRLPFDCADYLLNGCVAPFFNWGYIYKMPHLNTLGFDDLDFVMSYVADDSGRGRDFKPMLMFKYIPNLSTLIIGQDVITYPFETEESAEAVENIEQEVRRTNYFTSACDRYYNKTCEVTKSLRQWGVSNLTNYAKNRGNKGFFMYAGGVITRAAGSVLFATPEAVTRIGGGIVKGIAKAFRETTEASKTKQ